MVRKIFGYAHIPQQHAARCNAFCRDYLNPFLNYHGPCLFATELADPKKPGRIKRIYRPRDAMTPLDKLASMPDATSHLRPGITLADLQTKARTLSDLDAAQQLSRTRQTLFRSVTQRSA